MGEREGQAGWWTFDLVEERLIEAAGFLARLPGRVGPARLRAADGPWGQVRREAGYREGVDHADWLDLGRIAEQAARARGGLSAGEVDRMEEALGWVEAHVPAKGELRRLIGVVTALAVRDGGRTDWGEVKRHGRFKASRDALRMSYGRAIGAIAARLNAANRSHSRGKTADLCAREAVNP